MVNYNNQNIIETIIVSKLLVSKLSTAVCQMPEKFLNTPVFINSKQHTCPMQTYKTKLAVLLHFVTQPQDKSQNSKFTSLCVFKLDFSFIYLHQILRLKLMLTSAVCRKTATHKSTIQICKNFYKNIYHVVL